MSLISRTQPEHRSAEFGENARRGTMSLAMITLACLAVAAQVVSSRASGVFFWLLCLAGLATLLIERKKSLEADSLLRQRWFWLVVLSPVVMNILSVVILRLPARELAWLPLLAAPGLVLLVERYRLDLRPLILGSALAAGVALVIGAWGVWMLGTPRPAPAGMNQIIFGQFIVVAAVVCAAAWSQRLSLPEWIAPAGLAAAICALFFASFLGGLLALPVVLVMVFRHQLAVRRARMIWAAALAAVLLMLALFAGRPSVYDRLHDIGGQVAAWREGRVDKSSAGTRIELAIASVRLISERPWFGLGARRFHNGLAELRQRGQLPADVQLMHHAHNSYLNLLVEYGIVGFLLMLAVVLKLWQVFSASDGLAARVGRCVLLTWLLLGLTNDVLAHQTTLRAMVLVFSICLACMAHEDRNCNNR